MTDFRGRDYRNVRCKMPCPDEDCEFPVCGCKEVRKVKLVPVVKIAHDSRLDVLFIVIGLFCMFVGLWLIS